MSEQDKVVVLCLLSDPEFSPSNPPTGYLEWHHWAAWMLRKGHRQYRCLKCTLYHFVKQECKAQAQTAERARAITTDPEEEGI